MFTCWRTKLPVYLKTQYMILYLSKYKDSRNSQSYHNRIFQIVPRWGKYTHVLRDYNDKQTQRSEIH